MTIWNPLRKTSGWMGDQKLVCRMCKRQSRREVCRRCLKELKAETAGKRGKP